MEFFTHAFNHWDDLLKGAIFWAVMGHAVNTFPVPENKFGRWLLSTVQFAVGQRTQSAATKQGEKITGTGDGN